MKKIFVCTIVSSFVFTALCVGVYGANSDKGKLISSEARNNNSQQTQNQTQNQNQGDDEGIMVQPIKARTVIELKQMIRERKQVMEQELGEMKEKRKEVRQNQNEVMLAVHSFLASEELVGGIGPQVSEIARGFNNSVQATIIAEEKINSRNKFVKLFIGGDDEAADEIEQEVNKNRARIQNLNQLMKECECDEEVRNIIQEQLENTEQEQDRLKNAAKNEKAKKGLFGWLKNIFRFGK